MSFEEKKKKRGRNVINPHEPTKTSIWQPAIKIKFIPQALMAAILKDLLVELIFLFGRAFYKLPFANIFSYNYFASENVKI